MATAKKKVDYGFDVTPQDRDKALGVLRRYVDERVMVIKGKKLDLQAAVQMMDALYGFKEALAEQVKSPTEKAYDTLRFSVIPEAMDEADIRSVAYDGIGKCHTQDDIQLSTLDKDGLKTWLIDEDLADMIVDTVNAQTLAAALRKRLKEGKPMPPANVVKVTPIVKAIITRS
jgi:hypothetical protein